MSSDNISRRNRANARKSTGPKTREGKAKVAGNALKHGATAQPDPESVATWLAIILDRPEVKPEDLIPQDDVAFRALTLAKAEAKLVLAEFVLQIFGSGATRREGPDYLPDPRQFLGEVFPDADLDAAPKRLLRTVTNRLYNDSIQPVPVAVHGGKQHKLRQRYVAESRSKRRKALAAWLEIRHRTPELA